MSQADKLERQRQRLIALQERLGRQFAHQAEAIRDDISPPGTVSHLPTHLADQDVEGLDVVLEVGHAHDELLEAVAAALERIDDGSYGKCASCGRPISSERLQAIPYAIRCVQCEQQEEAAAAE